MDTPELLSAVEVQTADAPDAAVIWLHGLGADGHDFEGVVPMLGLAPEARVRFVFPHAPVRPVTLNGGRAMRAWYDVYGIGPQFRQDEPGIRAARAQVEALIAREHERGVRAERVVLAGFSQGGAVALYTGLRHPHQLAGLLGLSTWLPVKTALAAEAHPANRATPVLMLHGTEDSVVHLAIAEASCAHMRENGYTVNWRTYPMGHTVCADELADIGAWLCQRLGP